MDIQELIKLRNNGKTYKEIGLAASMSTSTVYKKINGTRTKEGIKYSNSKSSRKWKTLQSKIYCFRKNKRYPDSDSSEYFNYQDVIEKFGINTKCYLTGRSIDLAKDYYELDHIIPLCRGGSSNLDNLGITCKDANQAKAHMTLEEFKQLCIEVLNK